MSIVRSVKGSTFPISEQYIKRKEREGLHIEKYCKVCGQEGRRVLPVTMATHLDVNYWPLVSDGSFFCFTAECPVIYFNNRRDIYFVKDEVKTRFGLKEKESPRPICYCLQVTEEQIEDEILNKSCCYSLEDIEAYTRAGTGKWCLTTNPSGKCCREYLPAIVDKYLKTAIGRSVQQDLEGVKGRLGEPMKKVYLAVQGMTCESCAIAVKSAIESIGGKNVSVSLKDAKAEASIPISVKPEEIAQIISESGYETHVEKVERT